MILKTVFPRTRWFPCRLRRSFALSTINFLQSRHSSLACHAEAGEGGSRVTCHCCGNALPFRGQTGKIVGQTGEIAIDRSGTATRCVSRRIFRRQFFLLCFQGRELHFDLV